MKLLPLKICVEVPFAQARSDAASRNEGIAWNCRFCGLPGGLHAMRIGQYLACVLCGLVQSLHRSTIDEEARLIWLPEMSQAALNVLVRQVHVDLHELDESVFCEDTPRHSDGMRPYLYMAQRMLLDRSESVAERLGSSRPSDLADALTLLKNRELTTGNPPLGGLRILPKGRFYAGGVNVYDDIVSSWGKPCAEEKSGRCQDMTAGVA